MALGKAGSPQQQADRTKLVRSGFLKAYEQFKPYFEALGVKISQNPYMEAGIATLAASALHLALESSKASTLPMTRLELQEGLFGPP